MPTGDSSTSLYVVPPQLAIQDQPQSQQPLPLPPSGSAQPLIFPPSGNGGKDAQPLIQPPSGNGGKDANDGNDGKSGKDCNAGDGIDSQVLESHSKRPYNAAITKRDWDKLDSMVHQSPLSALTLSEQEPVSSGPSTSIKQAFYVRWYLIQEPGLERSGDVVSETTSPEVLSNRGCCL